jgi:flagellar M-ring protein FliF
MNFDNTNTTTHEYSIADGREEGYIDSESHYTKEATGGYAGTPGTDSNDDTTYVINDNGTTSENITEDDIDRALNETVTITDAAQGSFDKENSSISVVATTYQIYNEDQLKADGTLDNQTFDEFKSQNSQSVKVDVDDDMITTVARATGIAEENISMVAYQVPYFIPSEESGLTVSKILEYVLAGLILLMLGFVIFMSLRPAEVVETEPELEVLPTLESAMDVLEEESKEDIQAGEKSETRILIEKFVDENPEAVASLLRNWLNSDWE